MSLITHTHTQSLLWFSLSQRTVNMGAALVAGAAVSGMFRGRDRLRPGARQPGDSSHRAPATPSERSAPSLIPPRPRARKASARAPGAAPLYPRPCAPPPPGARGSASLAPTAAAPSGAQDCAATSTPRPAHARPHHFVPAAAAAAEAAATISTQDQDADTVRPLFLADNPAFLGHRAVQRDRSHAQHTSPIHGHHVSAQHGGQAQHGRRLRQQGRRLQGRRQRQGECCCCCCCCCCC